MAIDTAALPFKVEYVGRTRRGERECFEWRVTFTKPYAHWQFPYYCGLAHVTKSAHRYGEAKPRQPSDDDILRSLLMDAGAADENFHDWCANFGYSDDSISALNTYKECLNTATQLRKFIGREVLAELAIQLQDH